MLTYRSTECQDADGNRGIIKTFAELESSDSEEICEQIKAQYDPATTEYTIYMYDDYEGEHEFEVDINDYFTYDELKEL